MSHRSDGDFNAAPWFTVRLEPANSVKCSIADLDQLDNVRDNDGTVYVRKTVYI